MVITRTPLRVSFFGGGTDYPAWYREHGGAVISTSIDKYSYITVRRMPPFHDFRTQVVWSRIESVNHVDEIVHPSVRETIKFAQLEKEGLGIHYDGDVPARAGLGSSSSFTVGFLNALYALQGRTITKEQLARESIHIEQNLIKENVGSQDQVAAAFGGFNKIIFGGTKEILVSPIKINEKRRKEFQSHLMLFFIGLARTASVIAAEQIKNIPKKERELHAMREMVDEAERILLSKKNRFSEFGRLLHENWRLKRSLSSKVSNTVIDAIYTAARRTGASGGKILGAGAGGFLLLFADPEIQPRVKKTLKDFLYVPFSFENLGSVVMYKKE